MASEKQIAANRLNSQKSTGPRSGAGKQAACMNALKSGIHAQSHVIRGEDPTALAQLAAEYNAEFHPTTPRQRDLVDTLVHNEWKIRRLRAIETDLWEHAFERNDQIYDKPDDRSHIRVRKHYLRTAFDDLEDRLERLQRRLHAYERSTQRTLKQLQQLQQSTTFEQIGFVPSEPGAAAPENRAQPSPEPLPDSLTPDPRPLIAEIGFVPPAFENPAKTSPMPLTPLPESRIPHPEPPAERSEPLLR